MTTTLDHQGCRIAFDRCGAGPPVLLVQGVGVHGAGWKPQVDDLAARFSCVTFDHRGIGRSQPPGSGVSVEQMADDGLAVLAEAGCDSAHVVGHSLGGLAALRMAAVARSRVRSLALLCTFACGRDAAPPTRRMILLGLGSRVGTRRMRRRAFLRLVMPVPALENRNLDELAVELEAVFGHDLADQPPVVAQQLRALRRFDARPGLPALAGTPVMVVAGAHDPIAPPAAGRRLAAAIPGAQYEEFADASHGLPIQHRVRVNQLLLEHLQHAERQWNRRPESTSVSTPVATPAGTPAP